jgi:hypothetical protein
MLKFLFEVGMITVYVNHNGLYVLEDGMCKTDITITLHELKEIVKKLSQENENKKMKNL